MLSSTATGMTVHAFTEDGLTHFDDEPEIPEPDDASVADDAIELPEIPTDAGFPLAGLEEHRRAQGRAARPEHGARQAAGRQHRLGHAKVQVELNRLVGIMSVGSATNSELERRLRHGEAWLRRR